MIVRDVVEDIRGRQEKRLLMEVPAVWYPVCPDRDVTMVIARDPRCSRG